MQAFKSEGGDFSWHIHDELSLFCLTGQLLNYFCVFACTQSVTHVLMILLSSSSVMTAKNFSHLSIKMCSGFSF